MRIVRNDVARFYHVGKEDVFARPALMDRNEEREPKDVLNRSLQQIIAVASGVGLSGHQHRRPLLVAHGACAAIRQQINIDIICFQLKDVEAGLSD